MENVQNIFKITNACDANIDQTKNQIKKTKIFSNNTEILSKPTL